MTIINQLKNGGKLTPMKNAGYFFEDGAVLTKEINGMVGIQEVLTADIISLEKSGLIFWNWKKQEYILTKRGER